MTPQVAKIAGTRDKVPRRGFPASSYAHLLLSEDDEEDQGDQLDEQVEDERRQGNPLVTSPTPPTLEYKDHQAEASKHAGIIEDIDSDREHIQIGGPTYMKLFNAIQLEKKVAKLEKENIALRERIRTSLAPQAREKDRVITLLKEQNDQVNRAIRQQNQLVARIANTISLVFQEYQETVENSGHLAAVDVTATNTAAADDNSDEIKVYSQFDADSDSGSEY